MNMLKRKILLLSALVLIVFSAIPARAGGPLLVTGPDSNNPGQPYRWALNPLPYLTDRGGLGNQTNAQANDLVSSAFQIWQDVETANMTFMNVGQLDYDITPTNIWSFYNGLWSCSSLAQPVNSIVYDEDGGILEELGYDNNSTLGFAGILCFDDAAGIIKRGWSVLNGRFIDGSPNTTSHNTVSLENFKIVFIHEFGHLLGLDHSQINLNCLTESTCPNEDADGLPMMFPILLPEARAELKTDDKAFFSMLYPSNTFGSASGRLRGRVRFSDGQTQAQGYNVIARMVGDPRSTAVSCVSGYLYTAVPGNPFDPDVYETSQFFGSQDQTLVGYFDILGLPPGEYTVEVEAINNSGSNPFVESSSVGPIGAEFPFQFSMPGTCTIQYLNRPSSPSDSCSDFSTVTVGAGEILDDVDIIFLGTSPRYDAWEDGP
jgi:hypothetical protein